MGLLRITLALAVLAAHTGSLLGLRFFGGGVMAVESFFIISGFYMALVLSERYAGRIRDFYFNRFLRLFPLYWLLLLVYGAGSLTYGVATGRLLGPLAEWHEPRSALVWLWTALANFLIVGSDWAELATNFAAAKPAAGSPLIAIPAVWSLAVEIAFYLVAPAVLLLRRRFQLALFVAAGIVRWVIWTHTGGVWTAWLYYFVPASWIFFLAGVLAYQALGVLQPQPWFRSCARPVGWCLLATLVPLVVFYEAAGWLRFQDWRYYVFFALSLPFVFTATRDLARDNALGEWSYPIYLGHVVVLNLSAPLRHFISERWAPAVTLAATLALCAGAMAIDRRVQRRFKRPGAPRKPGLANVPKAAIVPLSSPS